jgi:GAF domain-containing protein
LTGTAYKVSPEREQVLTTEEAALRHVAMLVARGAPMPEIFDAVAEQVARIFGRPCVGVMRYDSAESFVVVATWGEYPFSVGSHWPLDGPSTFEAVLRTGRPEAVPDYTGLPGTVAQAARAAGIVGGIGAPIVVDGATWGVIALPATREAPIPAGVETRLSVFTELVATAISNADARASLALLADEQAALRRVATLVARESSPVEIFGAVTEEARRVLASEAVGLLRFDPGETATLVAQSDTPWDPPPLGTRFTLDGENVVVRVFRTAQTARVDDWSDATGAVAAMASVLGVRSAVGAPVVVEGRLWGTIIAATSQEPLPATTESRLVQFTGLVATAIANAGARDQLSRLAEEQAALRRVAVLVAQQPSPVEVFAAVTEAVGPLLGADLAAMHVFGGDGVATVVASWSQAGPTLPIGTELPLDGDSAVARIFHTGAAARIDGYADADGETAEVARGLRLRTAVGAPILVEGKLWGALMAATRGEEPLPEDAEARIAAFTELVATAVANAQSHEALGQLVQEQAALRRVATLIAEDAPPAEFFRAVAVEVGTLLRGDFSGVARLGDGVVSPLAGWAAQGEHPQLPERWPMQPGDPVTAIAEAQHAVRWDAWTGIAGPIAEFIRDELGVRSTVGTPIFVGGRIWGVLAVHSRKPLPQGSELRMEQFSNLVATAIGNAEARGEVARLANEQAALRRIATLVARGVEPEQVFAAVTEETAATFNAITAVMRFEHDPPGNVVVGASKETGIPIGTRWPFAEGMTSAEVYRTGRSARLGGVDWTSHSGPVAEAGLRFGVTSQVACPIIVEGNLWGVVTLNAGEELPRGTEQRLEKFTELVTTAIANAEAGVALRTAADEQGALRRVATLVAASAAPSDVFAAVTAEIALVLAADATLLCRADPDGAAVVVGRSGDSTPPVGTRLPQGGRNLTTIVLDTGHPARIESYDDATGDASEVARSHGLRSAVGAPILVEGRLWGLVIAGTTGDEVLAPNAEERLAGFTELVATAISNATARAELVASRARIVAAGDEARRRIERNLHDGTQQRLIALGLDLQRARAAIPDDQLETQSTLVGVEQDLEAILLDLRELSHGLHPQLLSRLGLGPSLHALARRSPIPVHLDVDLPERPAASLETAVYYVVSEALTNAIKHSHASEISVTITSGKKLAASIVDDGVGDADPSGGSGLTGLLDRIDALGGRFALDSPPHGGTRISIELPVEPRVAP